MSKQGGIKDVATGRLDIYRIDPSIIRRRPNWNCRDTSTPEYKAGIEDLANQISAAGGVKEPLTVHWEDGAPWVTNGHRRLDAVDLLRKRGLDVVETVPVQTEARYADEGERVLSMIIRNSGVPFTPLENAAVFQRLVDLGWDTPKIAESTGLTTTRVRQTLGLLTLPEAVKEHVKAGSIAPTTAAEVVKKAGPEKAGEIISRGVEVARTKGRSKTTAKDMIEELVGGEDESPDFAATRAEGMEPASKTTKEEVRAAQRSDTEAADDRLVKGRKLINIGDRLKAALKDAVKTSSGMQVTMSKRIYKDLCDALGIAPKEPE